MPLISILTPTYNRGKTFLEQNIKSVQNQLERGFEHEHIIADNASTDNTEEVVRNLMKDDPRIKYIKNEKNLYAPGALNAAFEHSKGELVVPLDDDDVLPKMSLQMRFDAMAKNPNIKWTSGCALLIDSENNLSEHSGTYIENILPLLDENYEVKDYQDFFLSFFKKWFIFNGTVTIRRECIEEVGGWDPEFTDMQDMEMWFKLAHKKFSYQFLNNYLLFYRIHPNQATKLRSTMDKWKHLHQKLRQKYGIEPEA